MSTAVSRGRRLPRREAVVGFAEIEPDRSEIRPWEGVVPLHSSRVYERGRFSAGARRLGRSRRCEGLAYPGIVPGDREPLEQVAGICAQVLAVKSPGPPEVLQRLPVTVQAPERLAHSKLAEPRVGLRR